MNEVLDKNAQEKSIKTILSYPLNQVRYWASEEFAQKKFSPETFETLVAKVRPLAKDADVFEKELSNVRIALSTGKAPGTPNLSSPHTQILWGGALATIANTPDLLKKWDSENVSDSLTDLPLWSQIAHCPDARTELRENAFILATSLKNPQTRIRWGAPDDGYPDVSYYFMPSQNMINLDMVWSLMIGMEQSRSANLHEIGHSQGTINTPQKVLNARKKIEELRKQAKDKTLPKEERQKLFREKRAVELENKLRYYIFDEAENNYANRYAVNQSQRSAQDFGVAINTLETTLCLPLRGGIEKASKSKASNPAALSKPASNKPTAMDYFSNVKKALRYSFYVNNGMAEDTDEGWASLGIRKEWLSGVDKNGNKIDAQQSFKQIREMCTQLEELQPTARDRLNGQKFYNQKMEDCSEKRCEIIDEIFDRFVAPLLPEMQQEQEKQYQDNKKQQKNQQQQQGQQQQQQSGGSGGSGGESQESEDNDNSGEEQGESGDNQQQGQSGKGQKGQSSSSADIDDDDTDNDGDGDMSGTEMGKQLDRMKKQMSNAIKQMMDDAEKDEDGSDGKDGKEGKEGKDKKDGKDGKDGKNGQDDKEDKKDGSGGKDGQDDKDKKEEKGGKEGENGKDKKDENKDKGETLEDLVKKANDENNTQTSDDKNSNNESDSSKSEKGERRENWQGQEKTGGKPTINDFLPKRLRQSNEYKDIIARHQLTARKVSNLLTRLQNEYFGKEIESRKRVLVPEDNDITKFDLDSYVERRKKLATGQEIDERDYEHFKVKGEKEKTPAPIDIAILIDRSGSMGHGKGSKLDLALATACVLYEAARKNPYFNVYITAMGEPKALSVAEPGQSEDEIAKKIMTVQDVCGGCQDHMKDAILSTMEKIKGNKKQEYAGTSHFFVVSDGNFGDEGSSVPLVKEICENTKNMTFNFILTEKNRNKIEALSDQMSKGMGSERIDRVHISGESGIETALSSMLNRRMVEMKRIPAQLNTQKSAQMGKLLDAINAKRKNR